MAICTCGCSIFVAFAVILDVRLIFNRFNCIMKLLHVTTIHIAFQLPRVVYVSHLSVEFTDMFSNDFRPW